MKTLKSLLIAAALMTSAAASAATDGHFYLGADLGASRSSVPGLVKSDATDVGVNVGYAYNKNVAFEVSHFDLGRMGSVAGDSKTKVNDLAVVGTYGLNDKIALSGRLGYAELDTAAFGVANAHHVSPTYGASVSYSIADNIDLRAGMNRYSLSGADHVTTTDVGVRYSFE